MHSLFPGLLSCIQVTFSFSTGLISFSTGLSSDRGTAVNVTLGTTFLVLLGYFLVIVWVSSCDSLVDSFLVAGRRFFLTLNARVA